MHWRGSVPLVETVDAFERLIDAGKIRYWGVSNFDVADLDELFRIVEVDPQTDQVLYNLTHRGIEWDSVALVPQPQDADHGVFAGRGGDG